MEEKLTLIFLSIFAIGVIILAIIFKYVIFAIIMEVAKPFQKEAELTEKMERLAELNALLNMDEKEPSEVLGMEGDTAEVAERPSKAVTMAGRVSDASRIMESMPKPSILGKLKEKQEQLTIGQNAGEKQVRKNEQIL